MFKWIARKIGGVLGSFFGGAAEETKNQVIHTTNHMTASANAIVDRSQQLLNQATISADQLLSKATFNADQLLNKATVNTQQLLNQAIYQSRVWQRESQEWRNFFQALMTIFFAIAIMYVFYKIITCCFSNSKNKPIAVTWDDDAIKRMANEIAEKIMESEQGANDLYNRIESEVQHRSNEKSGIKSLAIKLLSSNPSSVGKICVPTTAYYLATAFIFIAMAGGILAMGCGEKSSCGNNLESMLNSFTDLSRDIFAKHYGDISVLLVTCLLVAYSFGSFVSKNALANAIKAYATDAKTTITIEELGVGYFNDNFGISLKSAINTIKEANNIRKRSGKSELDAIKVTALLNKQGIFAPQRLLISGGVINIADTLERKASEYGRDAQVQIDLDTSPIVYTPSFNIL